MPDGILLGLEIEPPNGPVNRSTITHSVNAYWISMKGKQHPRPATDEEWKAAREIQPYHGHCSECKEAENRTILFGGFRLVPSHADKRTWIWVRPDLSPDQQWILLNSFEGSQWRTGSDIFTGGSEGSRGYSYYDVFDLRTGRPAITFGGYVESKYESPGYFRAMAYEPLWLAPHYLVGDLTEKNRSFLFCNPELADHPLH